MKFIRITTDETYENIRYKLDVIFGYPSVDTLTCIEPAITAPHSADGSVLLAISDEIVKDERVKKIFTQWVNDGLINEINLDIYNKLMIRPS
jgi:hypothetical protein